MSSDPVGPKGPFSGILSGAGATAGSIYGLDAMERSAADLPTAVKISGSGAFGAVGYVAGLQAGKFIDDLYRSVTNKEYKGKPAIAYSNSDMVAVSLASVPVSYLVAKAAAERLGAGVAATIATAAGLNLFTTLAFMFLNEGGLGFLDTMRGGGDASKESGEDSPAPKKEKEKCTGMTGPNPIDGYGVTGRPMKRENTVLKFMDDGYGPPMVPASS